MTTALKIAGQEVNRIMALGIPRGVDRSDLEEEANYALGVAVAAGTKALRLAVRNALLDVCKKQRVRLRHDGEMPAECVGVPMAESVVGELVFDLTPRQMTAVRLVFWEGMTQAEAAEEMNTCQSDISSLISAACDALKKKLAGYR